jgi:hypothetical protein
VRDDVHTIVRKLIENVLPKLLRPVDHAACLGEIRHPDAMAGPDQRVFNSRKVSMQRERANPDSIKAE